MFASMLGAAIAIGVSSSVHAQIGEREVRVYYYEQLRRDPVVALGYDALFPGAGSAYSHLYGNAIFAASLSFAGAALWTYGAVADHRPSWWIGASTFALGRTYGLVSAPLGAVFLNGAFRRQLRLTLRRFRAC
jgi:hypothetical protein